MLKSTPIDDIINQIIEKVRSVTATTSADSERFEALRDFADNIHGWLQTSSSDDRERFLEFSNEFFTSRIFFADILMSKPEEAKCLAQLLSLIHNPPPIL